MTTTSALLLPLGIWLVLAAATPRAFERRVAVSGMVTLLIAALAFATTGFLLPGTSTTVQLARFVPQLALALACAVLVNASIACRANYVAQALVAGVVGGALFPIANKWVLENGWLAALGRTLNFGHGAVDFGGLATVALVAGAAALAFVWVSPRKQANASAGLPQAQFPFRAVCGVVCVVIGSVVVFGSNPSLGELADKVVLSYFINLCVACGVAALCGLLYSRITAPQADVLCAARATLAAAIMVSSGAGALPIWVAASLGIVAGLLATIGLYLIQEKLNLDDDSALITSVLLPAIFGFLAVGLFADGRMGVGWNGVGDAAYLAVPQLGVVGLLPLATPLGDPGQLTAQLIAIGSIGAWGLLGAGVMAVAMRPQLARTLARDVAEETATPILLPQLSEPLAPTPVIEIQPIQVTPVLVVEKLIEPDPIQLATETIDVAEPALPTPVQAELEPKRVFVTVVNTADKTKPAEGLMERLRRLRRANLPEQPARARKVAYPTRVNGKRLIRPLVDESSTKR